MDICRTFTFVNYHIPVPMNMDSQPEYVTIGMFDGLITQLLDMKYEEDDLLDLWKYTLKRTAENKGYYSFQNTFGFSRDEWNQISDDKFWSKETNKEFPLTFIIFLQVSNYMVRENTIEEQCKKFNDVLNNEMNGRGLSYVYGTVDKNDFVVCVKCKEYRKAVKAIKKLHNTRESVVYSYSTFSIHKSVLQELNTYKYLFEEYIDSICLKGITNSYDSNGKVTLDRKYHEFCKNLTKKLYDGQHDEKLYDILGDHDFRLIARNVNLGKLLNEYAPGGVLCYMEKDFSYYLYSSNLVLNITTDHQNDIKKSDKENSIAKMEKKFVSPNCDQLLMNMKNICEVINTADYGDKKKVTFCQAVFQLLQSLKVLETAPTKKYDFYSLYSPFGVLVRILEEKIEKEEDIGEYDEIYEFIHKISMTLHGTLRTDIQFFQVRDFNVIVHYAPAKLRAFYALWSLKISDYYHKFCEQQNEYSFVFAPGLFKGINVKELFQAYNEKVKLMLITVPESLLYSPRWLSIIIGHEISHFVADRVRRRKQRHEEWLKISARIMELEFHAYMYMGLSKFKAKFAQDIIASCYNLLDSFVAALQEKECDVCKEEIHKYSPYEYYGDNSIKIIQHTFRKVNWHYIKQLMYDYSYMINNNLAFRIDESDVSNQQKNEEKLIAQGLCNEISEQLVLIYERFQNVALQGVLSLIREITSETFADMMAIITLELTPEEYILSFSRSEYNFYQKNTLSDTEVTGVVVRIAIVMTCVCKMVLDYRSWFDGKNKEFAQKWSEDIWEKGGFSWSDTSIEGKLISRVISYKKSIVNCQEEIGSYRRLYNINKETFSGDIFGFLIDKEIWDSLCKYLSDCGEEYMSQLIKNNEIQNERDALIEYYKVLAGKSGVEMMQAIEDFLNKNANNNNL